MLSIPLWEHEHRVRVSQRVTFPSPKLRDELLVLHARTMRDTEVVSRCARIQLALFVCAASALAACTHKGRSDSPARDVHSLPPDPRLIVGPSANEPPVAHSSNLQHPHPKVRELLTLREESDAGVFDGEHLSEAACRKLTASTIEYIYRCDARLLANETAAQINISYDCGEQSCSVSSYTWFGAQQAAYVSESAPSEVSPDHRYLLLDEFEHGEIYSEILNARTLRLDRQTESLEPFMDCFSARLSPLAHYYFCRDLSGNVLRAPVSGGTLEIVFQPTLPAGEEVGRGGTYDDHPQPVRFISQHEFEYDLYLVKSEALTTQRVRFRE